LIGHLGDGTIKKEIEENIAELGLEDNIRILGFRKDVSELLQLMDIFVLSSTSEGLPLSVIEAMASAKPVVSTSVGGLPEIVVPDRTGFLVEAKNAGMLAEKITILLENEVLRKQMGGAGRKLVEDRYSLQAMIDNYQILYENLIK
jgi:glycosyltransferase involved in cell wall biosynthesis